MRTYIIAEIGNTHEGSLGLAKKFIKAAAETGVDAVKLQTHIFEAESLLSAPNPKYFQGESRKEYFERTSFSIEQWKELKRYAEQEQKIDFFSSPFSLEAVELLESIGVETYKVASGEVSNIPLLERIGKTGKKVLLSSGMSSWRELDEAVETLRLNGTKNLVVLQCTSEYPCPPEESGLNIIEEMQARYPGIDIGYSDHTIGNAVPLAAVMKGAKVIEKHFTLSRLMYGSDAMNATEPHEFQRLVTEIRHINRAVGTEVDKDDKVKYLSDMKTAFEKSIVSSKKLAAGTIISLDDLAYKKPGNGIPSRAYKELIGKKLKNSVEKDHQFHIRDFQ